jgi:16S rRNA (guanine527-N7)-methyltransferase
MTEDLQGLVTGARGLGIELSVKQKQQFIDYANLVLEWNQRINLVRVRDYEELMRLHMLDSLWCREAKDLGSVRRLLDIGSGAGFPGIPLKICFPETSLYLLESQKKRCLFLQEAVKKLELLNCQILTGRAEELAHDKSYREMFDCVVSRALAPMATLVELTLPFVMLDGHLIALKGSFAREETVEAAYSLNVLGGTVEQVIPYCFLGEKGRNVVGIKKIAPTPEQYPRRSGIPAKRPLLEKIVRRNNVYGVEGEER